MLQYVYNSDAVAELGRESEHSFETFAIAMNYEMTILSPELENQIFVFNSADSADNAVTVLLFSDLHACERLKNSCFKCIVTAYKQFFGKVDFCMRNKVKCCVMNFLRIWQQMTHRWWKHLKNNATMLTKSCMQIN